MKGKDMKKGRIELVKTRAKKLYSPGGMTYRIQWHARLIAANGEKVWATETYASKASAIKAVTSMAAILLNADVKIVDLTKGEK